MQFRQRLSVFFPILLMALPASPAPTTTTGVVQVVRTRCFQAPCPAPLVTVGDRLISGAIAGDVSAFEGKTITMRGDSFAPGKPEHDFITGEVRVTPTGAVQVHSAGGRVYDIAPEAHERLAEAESATVTLFGELSNDTFTMQSNALIAKGQLRKATNAGERLVSPFPGFEWPDYNLVIPNGRHFPLYHAERTPGVGGGEHRWVTIEIGEDGRATMTDVSKAFFPSRELDPIWPAPPQPLEPDVGDGSSSVHRNAQTSGFTPEPKRGDESDDSGLHRE